MLLDVRKLEAGYGRSQVLFGPSFTVGEGEVVTLLGRNGMGKTTTVRCLSGLLRPSAGEIWFKGARTEGRAAHAVAHAGLGLVPEGRHIFPNLTVRENLVMAGIKRSDGREPWTFERVLDFFPRLAERLANGGNQLSGGEQQMLAIGRALMTNPDLLVLDEATEGLAPLIRQQIWNKLEALKATGLAMIVIDKEIDALLRFADRHYVVEKGEIVWSGDSEALESDKQVQDAYLSV
ncbi:MAG: ABC transporter ATP-binding protein [Hyphomicrobiales bacterium]|nr:ABC transporter ATP-binding protein [Hyphomicrobiales bacterium]MCC2108515.1 ABC transporter ATP-binding protein [Hyphomicrobiales bacterium]MCC2110577.1 ABC transporter ATP-binding protein [Hyphomicrobiales bacterium]